MGDIHDVCAFFAMKKSHDQQEYEFFGPYVPGVITVALPLVVLGLSYACNAEGCLQLIPRLSVPGFPSDQALYTHEAMLAVAGWFGLVLLLHLLLPGQLAQGVLLPNKQRLQYKLNGALAPEDTVDARAGSCRLIVACCTSNGYWRTLGCPVVLSIPLRALT